MPAQTPQGALHQLLELTGRDFHDEGEVSIAGAEPALPSRFLLATAGAASIAAAGVAAADLWRLRTGRGQRVEVKMRHAAAALRSGTYLRIDGKPAGSPWADISGFYRTKDGRWVQFHCNYPHHRAGVLALLGCDGNRAAVAAATAAWEAQPLEDALAAAGMCAAMVRSPAEWRAHPQARAVARLPLFEVIKIGDSAPEPLPQGDRPLSGVRVLDMTRVLAGPTGARTLAEHGADVLHLTAPHLPAQPDVDVDTGHGKLAAQLDLRDAPARERLLSLIREGDVFFQSYRPGTLAGRGLDPEALARLRPGIVYTSLSAYSHEGPWQDRRGFDSLVQSVSGLVHENSWGDLADDSSRGSGLGAQPETTPRHLPAQAIDYVSGYLLAFATMVALRRRVQEGGSYLVRVSLAQTGRWIESLGRVEAFDPKTATDPTYEDVQDLMTEAASPFGRLRFLSPAARLSETPARWERPAAPLDHDAAEWPDRNSATRRG